MKKPSFFIVGAPKSGTTALYEQLRQHRGIYMPRKEVYFFGKDLTYRESRPSKDYYHRLFEDAGADQLAGEASVWYLLSTSAAQEIHEYDPNARIIIMLRDPIEMVHSLHFEQFTNGNENIENFEEALEAEGERAEGERIPPLIGSPYEGLQYRKVGRYTEQVRRYFEQFGQEQVRVIRFEDFIAKPKEEHKRTLSFLGLEPQKLPSFERINAPRKIRSRWFRDLIKKRSPWMIRSSKFLLPSRKLRQKVLEKLEKANQKPTERPPMHEETRAKLREQFRSDVQKLSRLLGENMEAFWWGKG